MTREDSGMVEDVAPGIDETAVRQPLDVFAAITPFNFPAMIPLWFLPYAVATGNTFILKPSEKVPLSSQLIFEAVGVVGFPDGVVNLVNGGADTVNALLEHDNIEGILFVGSTPIAKHIYTTAAEHGKRVQAQGGAKNYALSLNRLNLTKLFLMLLDPSMGMRVSAVLRTMLSLVSVTYMLNSVNDCSLRLMTSRLALVSMRRLTSVHSLLMNLIPASTSSLKLLLTGC